MVDTDPKKIKYVLERGVEKIYPARKEMESVLSSGKRIRLYCGYDPTAPTLHLGHMITLKKMAQFQKLGHEVIMLIGDFTGMIGDPTEKLSARKRLTREEVLLNSQNYKRIASKFLDFEGENKARILFNSAWQDKLSFADLISLAANFTVGQMITRDFFQERIKGKKPIFLHEFLYPLAQAYDSLNMDVDLEIGGSDQTFNMLCGRDLMKAVKNRGKFVMALGLLTDSQGKKMGKTTGDYVGLEEPAQEIFGKIMSWPDSLIKPGLELLTDVSSPEIEEAIKKPREAKSLLAKKATAVCHDKKSAEEAEKEFNAVYREKSLPAAMPFFKIEEKRLPVCDLLVKTKLASSKSEARRLVSQKGVSIDGKIQQDWKSEIEIKKGMVIRAGKRKFLKIN